MLTVNKKSFLETRLTVFFISFFCISLELFLTRILNLKTYNHLVYVIIPFAILGYGIGVNVYFLQEQRKKKISVNVILPAALALLAVATLLSIFCIIRMPLSVTILQDFFKNISNGLTLSLAYLLVMLPFCVMGYIIMGIFSENPKESSALYGWDLCGAGCGAAGFFFLINSLHVVRSITLLACLTLGLAAILKFSAHRKWLALGFLVMTFFVVRLMPEIQDYSSDNKGWENFPKKFKAADYETLSSRWHPLGRTDVYRLKNRAMQETLYLTAEGTFEINLLPFPEYSYFSTNFLGGTPVYNLSRAGVEQYNSRLRLFSQAMEFPYLLLNEPQVVVIGTGGGRDIFLAKTHGARQVVGAEINPEIYRQMTSGGAFHEYSGAIYTQGGVRVENVDGRNLVKRLPSDAYDLVVLNGVDTYSGLSSGAYAYAESYLYTREALEDYLRLLNDTGILNCNRWFFKDAPRETLRLFVIAVDALRTSGITSPAQHIIVGHHQGWGMMVVRKTPFTAAEYQRVRAYFDTHHTDWIYPSPTLFSSQARDLNKFDLYMLAYLDNRHKEFIDKYTFDISPVTDDSPFFYKYYRLRDFNPRRLSTFPNQGSGFLIFLTQGLVLFQALVFCVLFIVVPLFVFRKNTLTALIPKTWAFVLYFAGLGVGFMFVEIPLMQKFTLLLGSPIHAVSVTLAALLIFSGIGSYLLPYVQSRFKNRAGFIGVNTLLLAIGLGLLNLLSPAITNALIGLPFFPRVLAVVVMILPMGISLGFFFPAGLQLITGETKEAMPWAWGINAGFSVLGSMLAIILAQVYGFNFVIGLAVIAYALAAGSYWRLVK